MRLSALLLLSLFASTITKAQTFIPTSEFPFMFKRMEKAVIHYGIFQDNTKELPSNIHVGTDKKFQVLVYINPDGTPMETEPDAVNQVEFPDGTYIPIEHKYFGKVVHEDSVGKVVKVYDLDRAKLTASERSTIAPMSKMNMEHFTWYVPSDGDIQLPMRTVFYFVFNSSIFEANQKNILTHINQNRRKEYRAYTRSAEVLSYSENSIIQLWKDFFVNYDKVLPFYKKK